MIRTAARLVIALLVATQAVAAQNTLSYKLCARDTVPDYGFASIDCINCEISGRGQPWIVFHNEPSIRGVRVPGPAAGKLRDGDVLVAIDGIAITTRAGAERYSSVKSGDTVVFRVRRTNDVVTVSLVAGSLCGTDGRKLGFVFSGDSVFPKAYWGLRTDSLTKNFTFAFTNKNSSRFARGFTFRLTPAPYFRFGAGTDSSAAGWIGIGMFRMVKTTEQLRTRDGSGAVFGAFPEIAAIAPGSPAELAGVALGDTLIAVDGISVLAAAGAMRFLNAPPGVPLELTLRRNGQTRKVTVVPQEPPPALPSAEARYLKQQPPK